MNDLPVTITTHNAPNPGIEWTNDDELLLHPRNHSIDPEIQEDDQNTDGEKEAQNEDVSQPEEGDAITEADPPIYAPKEFNKGPWLDPTNQSYGRGKRLHASYAEFAALAHGLVDLEHIESAFAVLADDEPSNYREAMASKNSEG